MTASTLSPGRQLLLLLRRWWFRNLFWHPIPWRGENCPNPPTSSYGKPDSVQKCFFLFDHSRYTAFAVFWDLVTQQLIDKGDAFAILQGALGLLRGDTKGLGLQFYGCYGLCGRILLMASLQVWLIYQNMNRREGVFFNVHIIYPIWAR